MRRSERQYNQDEDNGVLDFSIVGDAEEQNRIQLERNLQDLSIALSITADSQASGHGFNEQDVIEERAHARYEGEMDGTLSLEYPRHNSAANDVSIFHGYDSSVIDRSHMTNDYDPHFYSHPTADAEDGFPLYAGDTISTAAHHASALTLTAGLTGKNGRRRAYVSDASMSGAEFDAERPSEGIVNDMRRDMSLFDLSSANTKRYKKIQSSAMDTPDGTPKLEGNYRSQQSESLRRNISSASRSIDPSTQAPSPYTRRNQSSHRKLSTALNKVGNTFSPKRPRALQHSTQILTSGDELTPRARPNSNNFNVAIQPPTPSVGSQFSKMARDLANDIEASQRQAFEAAQPGNDRVLAHSTSKQNKQNRNSQRHPLHDIANHSPAIDSRKAGFASQSVADLRGSPLRKTRSVRSKSDYQNSQGNEGVHLPDVTGLTSAVGTPMKAQKDWKKYILDEDENDAESYFVRTLTALQTQLNQLESQNLVSRRRIRELEMELEACKLEIKRERTRVLEREEIIIEQQKEVERSKKGKGKARKLDESFADENRYKVVVEEKKALEALIATLRTHLTRLTAELSSHQELLAELRVLRDADQKVMQEKMSEVDKLRLEVDRLSEEVEVLRGVVEQGLQERRRGRDDTDFLPEATEVVINDQPTQDDYSEVEDHDSNERSRSVTPTPSSRPQSRLQWHFPDKTTRTDHATAGSTNPATSAVQDFCNSRSSRDSSPEVDQGEVEQLQRETSPALSPQLIDEDLNGVRVDQTLPAPSIQRTPEPTPRMQRTLKEHSEFRTPFPQIRGERLERLFFSAPEHNARTCAVCHRRRRISPPAEESNRAPWSRPSHTQRGGPAQDGVGHKIAEEIAGTRGTSRGKFHVPEEDRLPPQTVLTRVLRDLEDDFTHYKGIYVELAEQYKEMDAVSNVRKRNVLAEHLKEVINMLEKKGDQIAQLYDLLSFEDKPITSSLGTSSQDHRPTVASKRSIGRQTGLQMQR